MSPNLVSSTSFFLSNFAKKLADGKTTLDELKTQMEGSVITPASKFDNAADLVEAYGDSYFHGIDGKVVMDIAQTYIEGVTQAKAEGRYFGRNRMEVEEVYGEDRQKAENSLVEFYNTHGFGVMPEEQFREAKLDSRPVGVYLMDYYSPVEAFTNKPSMLNGEQVNPGDIKPLPRA